MPALELLDSGKTGIRIEVGQALFCVPEGWVFAGVGLLDRTYLCMILVLEGKEGGGRMRLL